jgi:hypothetical protein
VTAVRRDTASGEGGKVEISGWIGGGALLTMPWMKRRAATPGGLAAAAELQRLLDEAGDLARRARDVSPATEAANASICSAFQRVLAREVHAWLQRAEAMARAAKTLSADAERLNHLRCLIDAANVAIMRGALRGARSSDAWPEFCAAVDRCGSGACSAER